MNIPYIEPRNKVVPVQDTEAAACLQELPAPNGRHNRRSYGLRRERRLGGVEPIQDPGTSLPIRGAARRFWTPSPPRRREGGGIPASWLRTTRAARGRSANPGSGGNGEGGLVDWGRISVAIFFCISLDASFRVWNGSGWRAKGSLRRATSADGERTVCMYIAMIFIGRMRSTTKKKEPCNKLSLVAALYGARFSEILVEILLLISDI